MKKKTKIKLTKSESYLISLLGITVVLSIIFILIGGFDKIFSLLIGITGGLIALYLFFWNSTEKSQEINEQDIDTFIKKVFMSEVFQDTFCNILPSGKEDVKNGISTIPSLLRTLKDRRIRFERNAKRFLNLTITLGIIFIGIVIGFGYLLLNDYGIGSYSTLRDIDTELIKIKEDLSLQNTELHNNEVFIEKCSQSYKKIRDNQYYVSVTNKDIVANFKKVLMDVSTSNNSSLLKDEINRSIDQFQSQNSNDSLFYADMQTLNENLMSFFNDKTSAYNRLSSGINNLETFTSQIKTELNETNNRIAEILKRLILSLVIITFFLTILRYTASLYKTHHNHMVKAELEDYYIRKFYISYRSSEDKQDDRINVIKQFMMNSNIQENLGNEKEDSLSEEEYSILKKITESILKKI